MSSKVKSALLRYGISVGLCVICTVLMLTSSNLSGATLQETYRILSDAFSLPGLLVLFAGLLVWLSNEGALNGVTWMVTYAFKSLIPGLRGSRERYGDYVLRQQEKRVKGYGFLFLVGGVFLAIGIVFMILFNAAY